MEIRNNVEFEMPEAKVILFDNEDVITTSVEGAETGENMLPDLDPFA